MGQRLRLQVLLESLLGSRNVYFQPPGSQMISYPCIVYSLSSIDTMFADNKPYNHQKAYMVTVIDRNPDSEIPEKIAMLPMCKFNRHYTKDNLNHDIYTLYY